MAMTMTMVKAYEEAKEQRFVLRYDPFKCVSDYNFSCEECPAADTCRELSQGDYKTFLERFKTEILPEINND